jgi:hypothetical protein
VGKEQGKGGAGYESSTCFMALDGSENTSAARTFVACTVTVIHVTNIFAQTIVAESHTTAGE